MMNLRIEEKVGECSCILIYIILIIMILIYLLFLTQFAVLRVNFVENIDISANSGIIKMNSCKHYTCFCNMMRRVYYET